jgi:3-hydroxyacyl-[acyl-carrier-protein] dehydratase
VAITKTVEEIMKMLPHRYPFLLIDRILEVVPGESARGLKNVTFNEPHFNGHFPDKPIMPGVLIIEAMAQTAAIVVCEQLQDPNQKKDVFFMSIEEAKFRKPVVPGDQLIFEVTKIRAKSNVWKFACKAFVDDKIAAEATLTAMIVLSKEENND